MCVDVCVCVCVMYTHMSECAGICACVQTHRTQDRMPEVFFCVLRVTALRQDFLLNLELASEFLGSSCLHPLMLGYKQAYGFSCGSWVFKLASLHCRTRLLPAQPSLWPCFFFFFSPLNLILVSFIFAILPKLW